MHVALVKYTVMRLAIFVAVMIVLGLIMRGPSITWLVLSAVISMALSYLFLTRPREQLTQAIVERTEQRLTDKQAAGLDRPDDQIEDEAAEAALAEEARKQN